MPDKDRRSGASADDRGEFNNRNHARINRRERPSAVFGNGLFIPDKGARRIAISHIEITTDIGKPQLRGHHFGKHLVNQRIKAGSDGDRLDEAKLPIDAIPDCPSANPRILRQNLDAVKRQKFFVKGRIAKGERVKGGLRWILARLKPERDGAHGWPPSLSDFFFSMTTARAAIEARATPRQILREASACAAWRWALSQAIVVSSDDAISVQVVICSVVIC